VLAIDDISVRHAVRMSEDVEFAARTTVEAVAASPMSQVSLSRSKVADR